MRDLYKSLGVERTASQDDIKRAFRKLTSKYHPDRNPGDAKAEERFKEISQAYEVLSDTQRRKDYDEFGEVSLTQGFDAERARAYRRSRAGSGGGLGADNFHFSNFGDARATSFDDLLSRLFGGGQARDFGPFGPSSGPSPGAGYERPSRRGQDITGEVVISLKDSLLGTTVPLRVSDPEGGSRTLDVKIPQGVADGGKLRLRGQGSGSPPGDILLTIKVQPGKYLTREGNDLRLRLPVTALEAYRGGPIDVPTPWGTVTVKLPAGSQSGQTLRVRGKGVHSGGEPRGDLLLMLDVILPPRGDAALLKALERLQEGENVRAAVQVLA